MSKVIKIFLVSVIFLLGVVLFSTNVAKAQESIPVYLFYGQGCPHCAKAEVFLSDLQKKGEIELTSFEIYYSKTNAKLFSLVGRELGISASGVPLTVIGEEAISGFGSASTTGKKITKALDGCREKECDDVVAKLLTGSSGEPDSNENTEPAPAEERVSEKIDLPFFGEIDTADFSLPLLTIVIAAVDGFNPCAMWVLIFLISLLFGLKNRRQMWFLGVVFLAASALVYFVFMAAWLNIFLFVGAIFWIRLAVAGVAVFGGIYNIRKFFKNKHGGCDVTNAEQKKGLKEKFQAVFDKKSIWLVALGLIGLAFVVNLIELLCSAGLPAIYTNILSMSELPTSGYYGYLVLYCLVFLLDDIIIFTIAMVTLKLTGVSTKYGRWGSLVGGIIMLLVAIFLIFFPQLLMFG